MCLKQMARIIVSSLVAVSILGVIPHSAQASEVKTKKWVSNVRVEAVLNAYGLPTGAVDGVFTINTSQALCVWRDLVGRNPNWAKPSLRERFLLDRGTPQKVPSRLVVGLNVSIACQVVIWVQQEPGTTKHTIREVFRATTGMPEFETRIGTHRIYAQRDEWQESDIYEGAMMYRPKYFDGGQALHGSATDSLVGFVPASHGCVRMLHSAIKKIWKAKLGIGTAVKVYGKWGK